jgi:hypothetical protein
VDWIVIALLSGPWAVLEQSTARHDFDVANVKFGRKITRQRVISKHQCPTVEGMAMAGMFAMGQDDRLSRVLARLFVQIDIAHGKQQDVALREYLLSSLIYVRARQRRGHGTSCSGRLLSRGKNRFRSAIDRTVARQA